MPNSGFLQRFHDLAEPAEATRVSAALGVKRALDLAAGSKADEVEVARENLSYAIRRLVRGVQSARLCCRQGFSLALAEVLISHPEELAGVLQLVRQLTEIQSGLKSAEHKARLMGRLCAYAAVCEAGCLRHLTTAGKSRSTSWTHKEVLGELGRGLLELYGARPFLREPVVRMATGICRELCSLGQHAWVPELFAEWNLEKKFSSEKHVHITGLVLELRSIYHDAHTGGKAVAAWPACVRTAEGQGKLMVGMASGLGEVLSSCGLGEQLPRALQSLCQWLVHGQDGSAAAKTWEQLDAVLFPEGSPQVSQARSLRALGELVSELCEARSECSSVTPAETVFTDLFERMSRGFQVMLQALARARWQVHPAAVFAQHRLVSALGAPQPPAQAEAQAVHARKGFQKHGKAKVKSKAARPPAPPWPLGDSARLTVMGALQKYEAFSNVPTAFQRQWQQALLTPLSAPGLRARCVSLLSLQPGGEEQPSAFTERARAAQLEQLAVHSRASDEIIMGVLCHFLAIAYFSQGPGQEVAQARSLQDFCSWAGLKLESTSEDLSIPVSLPSKAEAEVQGPWRNKMWSCLTGLFRRTLPETAAKVIAAGAAVSAGETDVEGDANGDQAVKTTAYVGMLADGSLLITRLHEWWDYLEQGAPAATPSKKRRRSGGAESKAASPSGLACLISLSSKDRELRRKCLEVCRALGSSESDQPDALSQRHRNAMCGFLLALLLALVTSESKSERAALRAPIEQVLTPAVSLKKAMTAAQVTEALAPISLVAAELYVNTGGLVKDAARMAWRELGAFTSKETLMSLCGSVRGDAEIDAEGEVDGDGEEEEDGGIENEGEAALPGDDVRARALAQEFANDARGGGDAEELTLDADGLWDQLVEDGDGSNGDGTSLMASFAAPNLGAVAVQDQKKLSKWEQRLRQQQEEAVHKFREVELLEVFLMKFVEKRLIGFQVLLELFEALVAAARRASGNAKQKEGETEKSSKGKKRKRADAALKRLHVDLAQRIAKVLSRALKKLRGRTKPRDVASWYSADEWATRARSLVEAASGSRATVASQQLVDVGATLLHFLCLAQRSAKLGPSGEEADGWELAEELLTTCLHDWAGKRDAERWCAAVFASFAVRTPRVLFGLPWLETLRVNRKHFVQRMQLSFFTQHLLRSAAEAAQPGSREAGLIAGFAELCAELLESSIGSPAVPGVPGATADAVQPQSTAQRKKLQRDALLGLRAALRTANRGGDPLPELAPGSSLAGRLAATMARFQGALQGRRGEIYQLCLHIQRIGLGQRPAPNKRSRQSRSGSPPTKRQASGRGSDGSRSPQRSKREKKVEA